MQGDWGSNATVTPGWERVRQSARDAATSPHTWVPLAGAALFSIRDFDEQTVEWASSHNPIFGNRKDAKDTSDLLADISAVNYVVSAIAVPSRSVSDKFKGVAIGLTAGGINDHVTSGLKSAVGRQRPDRPKNNSFPSKHASGATLAATLAARNIDHIPISGRSQQVWKWSSWSIAGMTAWARVEARRHFPSDVLAGYALGYFLGAFINDAFITPAAGDRARLSFRSGLDGGMQVTFQMEF